MTRDSDQTLRLYNITCESKSYNLRWDWNSLLKLLKKERKGVVSRVAHVGVTLKVFIATLIKKKNLLPSHLMS